MKKKFLVFVVFFLSLLTSCKSTGINQKETYLKIQELCDNYQTENITFSAILTCESKNIVLNNTGTLTRKGGNYTYNYSYQYLNKIGSASESLVSTIDGTINGTKEEITEAAYTISSDVPVVSLDIANSFKNYYITEEADYLSMKGYLARNTIIKNTDNLDNDIRFNYELITNKEVTKIEKLIISYVTVRFDSVVITITF